MLRELFVRGFRNLEETRWSLEEGNHLLSGPNGAGKTSLLEAIYFVATTRSFRTTQPADLCRHDQDGFALCGRVGASKPAPTGAAGAGGDSEKAGSEPPGRADIEVSWSRGGLERRVNGKQGSLAGHLAQLPVVGWTAADSRLLDGAPAMRRRFLDQGVVGRLPAALVLISRYRRALEQKRELLRTARTDGGKPSEALAAWNQVLAAAAEELMRARSTYVDLVGRQLEEIQQASGLGLPPLGIRYRPSPANGMDTDNGMLEQLERIAVREWQAGRPLIGPHRDEVEMTWGGREVNRVSSAGEKKLFGILLARARGGVLTELDRRPIYLLDDLDAELDQKRLEAAFELFSGGPQVIVTSSTERLGRVFRGAFRWNLLEGVLTPAKTL